MADCLAEALFRLLISADFFNDKAILCGSLQVKTPGSRSRLSLFFVTLPDHRLGMAGCLSFLDIGGASTFLSWGGFFFFGHVATIFGNKYISLFMNWFAAQST